MKKPIPFSRGVLCLAFQASLLFPVPYRAQASPVVWVVPSLQRVFQADSPGTSTQAQLYAARGEYESYQIVVRGPSSGLTNVNIQVTALQGPTTIPAASSTLYREQYVYVSPSSPNWNGTNQPGPPGWYPDALIPFVNPATGAGLTNCGAQIQAVPFSVAANTNQPVWVDVQVPAGAPAGQYIGSYTVTSDQGNFTGQVLLTVWNFALPSSPSLRSSFAYWQADSLAAEQELLRNRISPLTASISNELLLMSNYGLAGTDIQFSSGANVSNCTMSAPPSVSQFQAAAAAQAPGLYLFDYSADEIGNCTKLYPEVQHWAYNLHQAGIRNLVTMAPVTALFDDGSGTGRSAVDIWTILPMQYGPSQATISQALTKGDAVWSYNTLVQDSYSPKWEIDFDPINFRIQPGFLSQALNLTGILYWRVDLWSSSPWTSVNSQGLFSSNNYPGEGMLVYPGAQVGLPGVAPSMRLKWIRDGVDDYDYVQMLRQMGQGAWALQIINGIAANFTNWSHDPNALQAVRMQLGQELSQLSSPVASVSSPSSPTSPSPASGATAVPVNPTLSWAGSTNATSYDVYFGTATAPPLAANVAATSWSPGTLSGGIVYYWKVVAKSGSATAASAVWSFTSVLATPSGAVPYSVPPSSGSAQTQSFQLTYTDPYGYLYLGGGGALINNSLSGAGACWFYYNRSVNTIALASDDGSSWSSTVLGSGGSLSNSQCTLNGSLTSTLLIGNYAQLSVSITFSPSFAGTRTVYMYATNNAGAASSYQAMGTWLVP